MHTVIKTRLIKIGNSHGVRIPKVLRDQIGLTDAIELEVQDGQLIVRPSSSPRTTWKEQFQSMAAQDDDQLLDSEPAPSEWDSTEWTWE